VIKFTITMKRKFKRWW